MTYGVYVDQKQQQKLTPTRCSVRGRVMAFTFFELQRALHCAGVGVLPGVEMRFSGEDCAPELAAAMGAPHFCLRRY